MTKDILERAFEVFGTSLPDRDIFQATTANTVSMLEVRKAYVTWAQFEYEYAKFLSSKEVQVRTAPVVTKNVE
jgi:hypothetical protein